MKQTIEFEPAKIIHCIMALTVHKWIKNHFDNLLNHTRNVNATD